MVDALDAWTACNDVQTRQMRDVAHFMKSHLRSQIPPSFVRWCAEHETLFTASHFAEAHDETMVAVMERRLQHATDEIDAFSREAFDRQFVDSDEKLRRRSMEFYRSIL